MLAWPDENAADDAAIETWSQPQSNLILDFHGDPTTANLVVFSDGNHHMALEESLKAFKVRYPDVGDIFYATTPPRPILKLLREGRLKIGNFVLTVKPHLFLSPADILDRLVEEGYMPAHHPFVKNRGSVLLVRKGNPKEITGVGDLVRADVRLFLSNPATETVSYKGYVKTLKALATQAGIDGAFLATTSANANIYFGSTIHHREAPEAVAAGDADAAVIFYHLALRYCRIFPSLFDMVPLGGTVEAPNPDPGNAVGAVHAGRIGEGGPWGQTCLDFLFTPSVAAIYRTHGLDPVDSPRSQTAT